VSWVVAVCPGWGGRQRAAKTLTRPAAESGGSKSPGGVILSWNPAAERLYGYPASEVIGRSVSILQPPELASEIDSLLDRVVRGEHITHYETVRLAKGGRRICVSWTLPSSAA
jgi:PAS domain S-box-containing protein